MRSKLLSRVERSAGDCRRSRSRAETTFTSAGNYRAQGIAVQPDTCPYYRPWPGFRTHPAHIGEVARVSDNPLTARVTVNRVWQELSAAASFAARKISARRAKNHRIRSSGLAGKRFHGPRVEFQARRRDNCDVGCIPPVVRGPDRSRMPRRWWHANRACACPPS